MHEIWQFQEHTSKKFQYIWLLQCPQLKLITIFKIINIGTFKIKKRFKNYPLPKTKIVNLNVEKIKDKFIAKETIQYVKKYLEKGQQVLFFINRRGYAPYLICKKCGSKLICKNCSMFLTFHNIKNKAICHYCSYEQKINTKCKKEGLCNFTMYGPGVEKIFNEVKELFPEKKSKFFLAIT